MLSPGEVVRIDNGDTNWTITHVTRRGDLNSTAATNYYKVAGWPDPDEEILASRITGVVVTMSKPRSIPTSKYGEDER